MNDEEIGFVLFSKPCANCKGEGYITGLYSGKKNCPECKGRKRIGNCARCNGKGYTDYRGGNFKCENCVGTGWIGNCKNCDGKGYRIGIQGLKTVCSNCNGKRYVE